MCFSYHVYYYLLFLFYFPEVSFRSRVVEPTLRPRAPLHSGDKLL